MFKSIFFFPFQKEVSKKDKEIEDLQFELNPELLQEKDPSGRNRWFQVRCLQRLQAIRRTEVKEHLSFDCFLTQKPEQKMTPMIKAEANKIKNYLQTNFRI